MRIITTLALVAATATVVGASWAQLTPVKPIQIPKPAPTVAPLKVTQPPHIASATRPGPRTYTQGPITYEAEIVNPTGNVLETHLVVDRLAATSSTPEERGRIARVPVRVPANGRIRVPFTDSSGLVDGCVAGYARLSLESGSSTRIVESSPKCIFGMQAGDPMQGLAPDRRVQQSAGRLHYHTPEIVTRQLTCNGGKFNAVARNNGSTKATGARVEFRGPNGEGPQTPATFDLEPGKERKLYSLFLAPAWGFRGQVGRWTLRVEGSGVPVFQPGWYVNVTRLCSLAVSVVPSVPRLSSSGP